MWILATKKYKIPKIQFTELKKVNKLKGKFLKPVQIKHQIKNRVFTSRKKKLLDGIKKLHVPDIQKFNIVIPELDFDKEYLHRYSNRERSCLFHSSKKYLKQSVGQYFYTSIFTDIISSIDTEYISKTIKSVMHWYMIEFPKKRFRH